MEMEPHHSDGDEALKCRPPGKSDLADLCRRLNEAGARYVVVGGFAIVQAGYPRFTEDIDLLIETGIPNESTIIQVLSGLPEGAAKEVRPGDVQAYGVVRVADEIMVDLMKSGCGVTYSDAIQDAVWRELDGVRIPFASKPTLWRMKQTLREKDIPDRLFLIKALKEEGIPLDPPLPGPSASDPELPLWLRRLLGWMFRR